MGYNAETAKEIVRKILDKIESYSPVFLCRLYEYLLLVLYKEKLTSALGLHAFCIDNKYSISSRVVHHTLQRYFVLKYKILFLCLDIQSAYSYKLMSTIMSRHQQANIKLSESATQYLALVLHAENISLIEDEIEDIYDYIHATELSKISESLWREIKTSEKPYKYFLYGPLSHKGDCEKVCEGRELVYFKPVSGCDDAGPSMLFANGFFSEKGYINLIDRVNDNKYHEIVFRNTIPEIFNNRGDIRVSLCKEHPLFSSLLSLNRFLYHAVCMHRTIDVVVTGINYYTSNKMHSDDYMEVAIRGGYNRNDRKVLVEQMSHDLIFNFIYTKYLIKTGQVNITDSKDFSSIMNKNIKTYVERYVKYKQEIGL